MFQQTQQLLEDQQLNRLENSMHSVLFPLKMRLEVFLEILSTSLHRLNGNGHPMLQFLFPKAPLTWVFHLSLFHPSVGQTIDYPFTSTSVRVNFSKWS